MSLDASDAVDTGDNKDINETQPVPSQGSDFVKKLFQMLEENRFGNIVNWSDNGDSFLILDTNEFTKQVLPCYFKHSNFSSFVRQLNKYGFHKVKISNEAKQKYQLENVWEFKHPDFNRFDKSSIENIKRKIPAKKDPNADANAASSNCNHLTSIRRLEDRVSYLEKENSTLTNNISTLKTDSMKLNQKYNTLVVNLLTSKDINMSLSKSLECLYNSIIQLGGRVSSNIEFPHLDLLDSQNNHNHNNNDNNGNHNNSNHNIAVKTENPDMNTTIPHMSSSIPTNNSKNVSSSPLDNNNMIEDDNNNAQNTHLLQIKSEPFDSSEIKLTSPNNALSEQERIRNRPEGSPIHVLLVEDDDICIQLCRKFLIKYGCTVVVVNDGLSAISAVEQVKFDVILMDIVMPNLDGATATSVIRSFDRDTPIIAMTGSYHRKDLAHYSNHGMSDILGKPFTKDDLYMILKKHNINPVIQQLTNQQQMDNHHQMNNHHQQQLHQQQQHHQQHHPQQQHPQQQHPQQQHPQQHQGSISQQHPSQQQIYDTNPMSISRKRAPNPNTVDSLNTIPIITQPHDTLLTPSLLQNTGMTPDVSVFTGTGNMDNMVVPTEVDVQEALATVDMDLLSVPENEFGGMFKRQRTNGQ